jgi:hypothetical protein
VPVGAAGIGIRVGEPMSLPNRLGHAMFSAQGKREYAMPITRTSGQGRPKGALNKRTLDVIDKLAALHCDPITGMALIAMDEKNSIELRAKMFVELAQYIAPKRKAVEHSSDAGMIEALLLRLDDEHDLTASPEVKTRHTRPAGGRMAQAPDFTPKSPAEL